jgi:hypothetical protein
MENEDVIAELTNQWIDAVVSEHNSAKIAAMFCPDGNLVGTVSTRIRQGAAIEQYFDYFANLPGIAVLDAEYLVSRVTDNVYLNTAFITWTWDGQSPLVARMSFLFRDDCIFQLHSSVLPEANEHLRALSRASTGGSHPATIFCQL